MWWMFFGGTIAGTLLGTFISCVCFVAGQSDEYSYDEELNETEESNDILR